MEERMISISLCMIVKNEENTLGRCLDSLKDMVDEIIIVDTGSTDRTIEIARTYTNNIYHFQWIDDFSAARNFAFEHASKEYILTMDADDIFDDTEKLSRLKETLPSTVDAITMKYQAAFDEAGNVLASLRQFRLVKRSKQYKWHGAVHEYLDVSGEIYHSDLTISHKRIHLNHNRNLLIYKNLLNQGISFTPRDLFYYGNELYDNGFYEEAIPVYMDFIQTEDHWLEDERTAYRKISECHSQMSNIDHAVEYALKTFQCGFPRSEDCCRLGFLFLQKDDPKTALHWFQYATILPEVDDGGIIYHGCSTWIPHLQLCFCHSMLGNSKKAYQHIVIAHKFNPTNSLIIENKYLLETHIKQTPLN